MQKLVYWCSLPFVFGAPTKKVGVDIMAGDSYHPWADRDHIPVHIGSDESLLSDHLLSHLKDGDSIDTAVSMFEQFSNSNHLGMTLGEEKGTIIEEAVKSIDAEDPIVILEFGSHIGDGTLRVLSGLQGRKAQVFSFESNQEWLGIGAGIVRHALKTSESPTQYVPLMLTTDIKYLCEYIRDHHGVEKIDGIFFDHDHSKFLREIQVLNNMKMLKEGTVIMADNALRHRGAMREFLEFMKKNSKKFDLKHVREPYPDQILVSVWKGNSQHDEL